MLCIVAPSCYLSIEPPDAKTWHENELARKYGQMWMDKALRSKG